MLSRSHVFLKHRILPVVSEDSPLMVRTVLSGGQPKQPPGCRWHASLPRSSWGWGALCNLLILEIWIIPMFVFYKISHSSYSPQGTLMVFFWESFAFHFSWDILPLIESLIISGLCKASNLILTLMPNYHSSFFFFF